MKRNETHSNRTTRVTLALMLLALATAWALPHPAAAAPPKLLGQVCDEGSAAGQCRFPGAVVADPTNGDIYVVDQTNKRIDQFTVWGQFIRAFGGGVVNGGAEGVGTLKPGSTKVSSVSVTSKNFVPGMAIEGTGIAPGTTVSSVSFSGGDFTLSKPATEAATGEPTALTSSEAPGNVPVNELQRLTVTATGGTFRLAFKAPAPDGAPRALTSAVPYNASAAEVQSALEGLATIGAGNVAVGSANPGGEAGVPGGPYTVEFKGSRFADTDMELLDFAEGPSALTGGGAGVVPLREGAEGVEVCTGADCREGVKGTGAGQFSGLKGVTIDSQGDLYVYEANIGSSSAPCTGLISCGPVPIGNNRVQKFDSEGNFLLMFGGGVDEGGGTPSNPGNLCSAEYIANGDVCGGGKRGSGPGEFGIGIGQGGTNLTEPTGDYIATGPDDTIYVGGLERIQEFNPNGTFKGLLADPDGVLAGEDVSSLAVDPSSGNLYFASVKESEGTIESFKPNVHKLSPAGKALATFAVAEPHALAVDGSGNLYLTDGSKSESFPFAEQQMRKFTPAGVEVADFAFHDGLAGSTGIATGSACGITGVDIYVTSHFTAQRNEHTPSSVSAYGSPPNPTTCPPPAAPPTIDAQFTTSADSVGATLQAKINPRFWPDATYYVEYGTGKCSEGGCDRQRPVAPGSTLTTATVSEPIATSGVFLGGLSPNTTYHYRFVAQSSGGGPVRGLGGTPGTDGGEGTFTTFPPAAAGKTDCANQAFRFGASAPLPDCRAYEMVSPIDKNGGDAVAKFGSDIDTGLNTAAADGERFAFASLRSFADPKAAPLFIQYLSSRSPGGWSTRSISPPRNGTPFFSPGGAGQFKAFSGDLCEAWLLQDSAFPLVEEIEVPTNAPNLYRADTCGQGGYELLTTVAAPEFDFKEELPETRYVPNPQGHSADGTHTVFRADAKLPTSPTACSTHPINRPYGTIFQLYETSQEGPLRLVSVLPSGKANCEEASVGGMFNRNADGFTHSQVYHGVSADGSRVFWSAGEGIETGRLYVRLNATQPQSKVVAGKCTEAEMACTLAISESPLSSFIGADPEGRTAIYTVGNELFEYDVEAAEPHLIATGVGGVAGMSEDASRIYFSSTEVLGGAQKNSFGEKAGTGENNLYLYEAGEGSPSLTFIGSLGSAFTSFFADPHSRSSRVTPDGGAIAFTSTAALNGYDNSDLHSGEADMEAYVYGAGEGGAGELHCVSCNPGGVRPTGRRLSFGNSTFAWTASFIPGWPGQLNPSHLLSSDGNRLFFQSFDALLPTDTNGKADVYEWERGASAQDCREVGAQLFAASAGGCISLITTGKSPEDSEVLDASEDGRDVFFETSSGLLPQDPGLVDVYDARAGGGLPQPPQPSPACEGEACQGAPAPPNDPTPGSSSFEGAGNVVEAKAKKKAHKKAHKKKHAKKAKKKQANKKRRAGR